MRCYINLILTVLTISLQSCMRVECGEEDTGKPVNVRLKISALGSEGDTRSSEVLPTEKEHEIRNLWVIQYDGTEDDAVVLGEPTYIEDVATFVEEAGTVSLLVPGTASTVVFLANTFEGPSLFQISQGSSLGQLKQRNRKVSSSADLLSVDDDGGRYLIMSDCIVVMEEDIYEGAELEALLERNVAKVEVTVRNESSEVRVRDVSICSVPDRSFYVTSFEDLSWPYPAAELFNTIDYDSVSRTEGETSVSLVTYLPVNLRGRREQNTSEYTKNKWAPEGATCILVRCTYGDDDTPVNYTYYLGEDMVRDFNLYPNSSYSYEFVISCKGDADCDSRIEDFGLVDYTSTSYELSNCYILNPGAQPRRFRIPIRIIQVFWGSDSYAYYEDDADLSLRSGEGEDRGKWKAFIIQNDISKEGGAFKFIKESGSMPEDDYFEVEVAPGTEGNVVVAVGPDDGTGRISWSWHLWITDYDPDECLDWAEGTDGRYVYPVRNGAVHRYVGSYWNNNRGHYIMDRNLGWTSEPYEYPEDNRGLLYYQYGRKDPIFFASRPQSVSFEVANESNAVAYSVLNPTVFIKSSNSYWTYNNKYNPSELNKDIIWNDPLTVPGENRKGRKSIFDPCPPGYRVPASTIWSDFRPHTRTNRTTNAFGSEDYAKGSTIPDSDYKNGFLPYNTIKGLQYWPFQGDGVLIPSRETVVYIPASGYINPDNGLMRNHGNSASDNTVDNAYERWSFLWAHKAPNTGSGYGYTSQPNHLEGENITPRARALPVRCITDK